MIVRVRVVLKRTVVGDWYFENLSGSHLQSQFIFRLKCQVVETSVTNNSSFQNYSHPTITLYELLILLGSNHLLLYNKDTKYLISIEVELNEALVAAESSLVLFWDTCISPAAGLLFKTRSVIFGPPISPPQAALGPERPRVGVRRKSAGRAFPSRASFLVLIIWIKWNVCC